jgi:aryl-alcohol dehydrogenase-like predicted oxidoreductase
MPAIGTTELDVFPLCLGGNVFGWTADERQAFAVLDAYADAGGNLVDTADSYTRWVEGSSGGESETIIGRWMAARGNRDRIVVATKVGKLPARRGLAAATIRAAADESLQRLATDRIDLYYAHEDDPDTPIDETLGAFGELIAAGKVRYIGASNFTAHRLAEALAAADAGGLPRYVALQPHHNLVERTEYRGELADLCDREGHGVMPYFALANGFLTGKYRPGTPVDSERAEDAVPFLDDQGRQLLSVLDEIAAVHSTTVAAVSLAWLAAEPAVVAPIASARTPGQVVELLPVAGLSLTDEELARLTDAHPGARMEGHA